MNIRTNFKYQDLNPLSYNTMALFFLLCFVEVFTGQMITPLLVVQVISKFEIRRIFLLITEKQRESERKKKSGEY